MFLSGYLFLLWFVLSTKLSSSENSEHHCHGESKYSKEANIPELTDEEMFKRGHLKPFGSHRPPDYYTEVIPHMIGPEDFYMQYVVKHKPVVIKGAALNWPAYHLWSDQYLLKKYGNVTFLMETKDDDKWNLPPEEKFSNFLKTYEEKNRYLVDEVTPEMREEITMPLCLRCEEIDRYFFVSYYWMSSGGTRSTLHIDTDENLLNVLKGHKRVYMVSPIYSADVYADDTKMLGVSPINTSAIDLEKYPRVKNVRYWVADVEEGDAVFIPQMWWHTVYSRKERQQAVALWWKSKPFWKKVGDNIGGPAIPRTQDSKIEGYSFAEALREYEEWVQNVSSSIPRIKCKEQMVKMSAYHFETDKIENAPQTLGDGGNLEEEAAEDGDDIEEVRKKVRKIDEDDPRDVSCDYDTTNKKSPCYYRHCKGDDSAHKCIRYVLDYCLHYEDRGCVINKPQFLNKLLGEEMADIREMKSEFKLKK